MKKLIAFLSLFLCLHLSAGEQLLLTVTSDAMEGTLLLKANLNELEEAHGLNLTKKEDPHYLKTFSATQLPKGLVLLSRDSYEVIRLHSMNFDVTRGGTIIVDYLSSGVTKSRSQIELEVIHDGQKWIVLHHGKRITEMFMEARKIIFGKVIGIKGVQTR